MSFLARLARLPRTAARDLVGWAASPRAVMAWGEPCLAALGLRGATPATLANARSVLVVRPDEIGDVVLTTPLLRELRHNAPRAWITLVVKPAAHPLVALCPYVDEVLTFAPGHATAWGRHAAALRFSAARLWRRRFDLALLPRWGDDTYHSRFLAYFSGAKRRVGYGAAHEDQADLLLTDRLPRGGAARHQALHALEPLLKVGGRVRNARLELWLSPQDHAWAEEALSRSGVTADRALVAFCPEGRAARKHWPVERFAELGRALLSRDIRLVVIGGRDEVGPAQRLRAELGSGVVDVAGQTTLRQTAALLRRCQAYIGNDTGPMHIAAAMGTPVVAVFCHPAAGLPNHPASPLHFGPWGVPARVLQPATATAPCTHSCQAPHAHCILGVCVAEVEAAVLSLLRRRADPNQGRQAA